MPYPYNYPNYGAFNAMPSYNPQSFNPAAIQTAQPTQTGVNGQAGYLCRPVTSRLEAEAVQVDFLGPGTIMPDLGHGVIYMKRFDPQSGKSDFFVFRAEIEPEETKVSYATTEDLKKIELELENIKNTIKTSKIICDNSLPQES